MWRGHNRERVLESADEKSKYLKCLQESYTEDIKKRVQLHAITIMGNHPHELGRIAKDPSGKLDKGIQSLSRWMRKAHGRYGLWYNRKHDRQGKVAYDRPKTKEVEPGPGVLRAMLYLDLNPVRAGIVRHPSRYIYSTHRYYAWGEKNALSKGVNPPDEYLALGKTPSERQKKYRSICDAYMRELGLIDDSPDESLVTRSTNIDENIVVDTPVKPPP